MPRETLDAAIVTAIRAAQAGQFNQLVRIKDPLGGTTGELSASGVDSYAPRTQGADKEWGLGAFTWDGGPIEAKVLERSDVRFRADGEGEVTLTILAADSTTPNPQSFIAADVVLLVVQPGTSNEGAIFRGRVSQAGSGKGDVGTIKLRCRGYLSSASDSIPKWNTGALCQLKFRGAKCAHTSMATASASGPGKSHTVDDTSNMVAGRFVIGDPNGTPHPVEIDTVDTGTTWTSVEDTEFQAADPVAYGDCDRTFQDCVLRLQTHRYNGFRGVLLIVDSTSPIDFGQPPLSDNPVTWNPGEAKPDVPLPVNYQIEQYTGAINPSAELSVGEQEIFEENPVPYCYGRVTVPLVPVERHLLLANPGVPDEDREYAVGFYVIGAGPIEDIRRVFTKERIVKNDDGFGGESINGDEAYWRDGSLGVDSEYVLADWQADRLVAASAANDRAMKLTIQERDFMSNTGTTYSGAAMLKFLIPIGNGQGTVSVEGPDDLPDLFADIEGRLVQAYTSLGATDGAAAWTNGRNPVWALLDALLDTDLAGVPSDLIKWADWKTAADKCAVLIQNDGMKTAIRTTMGTPLEVIPVDGLDGIAPGDTLHLPGPTTRVAEFTDLTGAQIFLDSAIQLTAGDVVQAERPRYTFNYVMRRRTKLSSFIKIALSSCNAHLYMDGEVLGIRVMDGIFNGDPGILSTDAGRLMPRFLRNTFRLDRGVAFSRQHNVVEARYNRGNTMLNKKGQLTVVDADAGGHDIPKRTKLDFPAVNTSEQALRCCLGRMSRLMPLENGEGQNDKGASPFRGKTLINGLELAIGDYFDAVEDITLPGGPTIAAPNALPDLEAWVRPDFGITGDPEVTAWEMKAGAAAASIYTRAGTGPQLKKNISAIGGHDAVELDLAGRTLTTGDSLEIAGAWTIAAVYRTDGSTSASVYPIGGTGASNSVGVQAPGHDDPTSGGVYYDDVPATISKDFNNETSEVTDYHIAIWRRDGTGDHWYFHDGVDQTLDDPVPGRYNNNTDPMKFNALLQLTGDFSGAVGGRLVDGCVHSGFLSDDDQDALYNYFADRYGFSLLGGAGDKLVRVRGRVDGIKIKQDLSVEFSCKGERERIRLDAFGPAVLPFSDNPYGSASAAVRAPGGNAWPLAYPGLVISIVEVEGFRVECAIVTSGFDANNTARDVLRRGFFELHASNTSGFTPEVGNSSETFVMNVGAWHRSFIWQVPDKYLEATIYAKLVLRGFSDAPVTSNELEIQATRAIDPDNRNPDTVQTEGLIFSEVTDGDFQGDPFYWQVTGGASMGSNVMTLTAAGDTFKRGFPFVQQRSTGVWLPTGDPVVVRVALRGVSAVPAGEIRIYLRDTISTTEWTLIQVQVADILNGTFRHYTQKSTFVDDIGGTLEIKGEYLAGGVTDVEVDKLMVHFGALHSVFRLTREEAESGYRPDWTTVPQAGHFDRALWTTGQYKIAEVLP